MKKDLLTLLDLEREDFYQLLDLAISLKKEKQGGKTNLSMAAKSIGLLFDKPSTRTRISFETAMVQLGGIPLFISSKDTQIARNEPVRDTARVLSRYLDGLVIRTFSQDLLREYAEFATIPVINALTDTYHPSQILSDLMTIVEHKGSLDKIKVAWVGDGNNVANSWINAAAILEFDLVLACPKRYTPDPEIIKTAYTRTEKSVTVTNDPVEAVSGADVIYTDVWASMGQESDANSRKSAFETFQVTEELVAAADGQAIVMHCLPAHRGEEISDACLEGGQSVVWDQAENKLHMNKAIVKTYMG